MNLYDAVQQRKKQKRTDSKQDDELKALRERVERAEEKAERRERSPRRDEYGRNFEQASALVQRQYDEGYGRLGSRFAMGDSKSLSLPFFYPFFPLFLLSFYSSFPFLPSTPN